MINDHTFGIRQEAPARGIRARFAHNRPALIAAGWFWLLFLVLAIVTLFTGWASRPVTLVLELALSLGAGVLAAWLHRRDRPEAPRYVRMGALAGFYLPLVTALVLLLIAVLVGIGSFGALLPLMIPYILSLPVELGACSMAGALGAWLFKLVVRG